MKKCEEIFEIIVHAPEFTSKSHPDGLPDEIDKQIQFFQHRVETWILNYAKLLKDENDAGFAILIILNSLPEMIAQFRGYVDSKGKKWDKANKGQLYKQGLLYIFPEIQGDHEDEILKLLYNSKRNAIAHMGLTSSNVILSGQVPNLTLCKRNGEIAVTINPVQWYERVKEKFEQYITELQDKSNHKLREDFKARMAQSN